jgi:hypothetical protein
LFREHWFGSRYGAGLAAHGPAAARDPPVLGDHDAVGHRHCADGKRSDGELSRRELGRFVL